MSDPSGADPGAVAAAPEELFCANHPSVPTALRCNRCGKPICVKCAVLTPVGYRCKECVRGQQSIFYTAGLGDYVIAVVVALPLSLLAGFLASLMGGFLFYLLIFAGPLAGRVIADVTHRAVGRRRGRYLWLAVCACVVLGALPFVAPSLLALLAMVLAGGTDAELAVAGFGFSLLRLGFVILYAVLAAGTAYSRLRFGK
jgi:hypothetical protein